MLQNNAFLPLLFVVAFVFFCVPSVVQARVYIKGDSQQPVNLTDGATITIAPSQTYDVFCSYTQYYKQWYRVGHLSESSITRLLQETTSPDVYAINTQDHVLTLQFRPFQSTHAGEYECRFTSRGQTLTPLSVFLTPAPIPYASPPPSLPSKVQGITVRTVPGSFPTFRVSWNAVSGSGITYTVCYSTTSGPQSDPPSNANCSTSGITGTSTRVLGRLNRGTTYYIWVAAVSPDGQGPHSDRMSAVLEPRIYTNDASESEVDLENGATLTITPSKTYDILCSDTRYVKDWYRVRDDSSISRYGEYTNKGSTPDVYATNIGGFALTLHFESFQSTDSGEYECRLRSDGLRTWSIFLTPTPTPPPSKVQGVTVTRTVLSSSPALRVSWSAVSGSGITYTVCYSTTSGTQSDPQSNANCGTSGITGTSTTLGPLSRGTTYYIWVGAVSSSGRGPYSDRRQGITYNVPGPVTFVQVRSISTIFGLIITWGPPSGSNYPTPVTYQLRYRERPSSGSPAGWSSTVERTATQRQYTTPVLKPGARYEVEVWAVTSIGNGQSVPTTAITFELPGPVTSLQVRPSTTIFGFNITWGPPSGSNYPTPVTYQLRYRERPSSGSTGDWSSIVSRTATQRQYTTPVLKPGTRYEVEVWAVSSIDNGQKVKRAAKTYDLPGPVTSFQVRPSAITFGLMIRWRPPSGSNYPTPVTYQLRYRERPSSGPPGRWSSTVPSTAIQRPYTLLVLKPGTRYEVEVWVISSIGIGQSSYMLATTYQVPGPVTSLQVKPSTTIFGLTVTWGAPSDSNYPTPIAYQLRYRERPEIGSPGGWISIVQMTATQYTTHVLKPGTRYEVQVWATSIIGNGQRSAVLSFTYQVPGQVTSLQVRPSTTIFGLIITWGPPSGSNYPTPVTYQLRYRERPSSGSPGGWSGTVQRTATQRQYTTPVLKPGTRYEVEVWAIGGFKSGVRKNSVGRTLQVPGPVTSLQVRPSTAIFGLIITWGPPSGSNYPTSVTYQLRYRERPSSGSPGGWSSTVERTATQRQYTTPLLKPGTRYEVEVWASYRLENGESILRTIATMEVPPPNDVSVYPLPQPGTVRVTWTPPNTTHGLNVTGYTVEYRKVDAGRQLYREHLFRVSTITEQTASVDLIGLQLGQEYYVRVAVVTIAGMGTYSDPVNVTTYADCCSGCSSVRSSTFATFKSSSKMVSEDTTLVHIEVYRYGPMERLLILRVIDEPGTALKVEDYSLQSRDLHFINTQEVVEKTTVVVKINNDDVVESGPPETFNLTLYSPDPGNNVVFSVHTITVSIVDNDYE